MSKLETSESHNLPLKGSIDLDAGYLRREPTYDPEAFTYSMSELWKIGSDCMEEPVANFLLLLQMRTTHEIEKRRRNDQAIKDQQQAYEDELIRKDD